MSSMDLKDLFAMMPKDFGDLYKKAQVAFARKTEEIELAIKKRDELNILISELQEKSEKLNEEYAKAEVIFKHRKEKKEKELEEFVEKERSDAVGARSLAKTLQEEYTQKLEEIGIKERNLNEALKRYEALCENKEIGVKTLLEVKEIVLEHLGKINDL